MPRLSVAFVLLAAGCHTFPRDELPPDDAHADAAHTSVAALSTECSGVLVSHRHVLTAAHCVTARLGHVRFEGAHGAWTTEVAACMAHPESTPSGDTECARIDPDATRAAHDLAVLTLAQAVPDSVAAPTPMLLDPRADATWPIGLDVVLVGWTRATPMRAALRRSGPNRVEAWRDGALVTAPRAEGDFVTQRGASGGPALLRIGGVEHVVGVLFGGTHPSSRESVFAATFEPGNATWLRALVGARQSAPGGASTD